MEHIELPEGGVDCSEGCNPYGFPPECAEALKQFDPARLGPYPHSDALYDAIRDFWKEQIDVEHHNVLLTDGSISALYIINNIFDTHNSVVLGISPQFTDYYMHAEMIGIDYAPYQLKPQYNYKFDASEFMSMHYIGIDIEDIERIVRGALKKDITVIIDEAYGDFMPKENSAVQLFARYPNLAVVRTLSKGFGLAGLRIGYMKKMINPYMVSELAREVGAVALRHPEFVEKSKADFVDMKAQIREVLTPSTVRKLKKHADAEYEEVKIHGASSGHLHMAETLDTNSLLLLYHDDKNINLYDEFLKRKVLVIDGYDFKGLDSNSARVRLPKMFRPHIATRYASNLWSAQYIHVGIFESE